MAEEDGRHDGGMIQSPQGMIIAFVIVATLIAGFAAPVAGFAILVLGLLGALIVDFSGWKRADDAGHGGRSPLGLMEPLSVARSSTAREPAGSTPTLPPGRRKSPAPAEDQPETSS